ncbi:MAG: hypothetical protein LBR11_08410 [Deltaproteobacteria bacterium]|jgi:hypothetical protein|nr:hypothetical protein [Deltaproteobacteria bacterium]
MDPLNNPFCLLSASVWDDSAKLQERISEKSLTLSHRTLARLHSILVDPRQRLMVEMAWLPGLSETESDHLLGLLKKTPERLLSQGSGPTPPLAQANLLVAALPQAQNRRLDFVLALAEAFDQIDPKEVLAAINEPRQKAGWPLANLDQIQMEIKERQAYCLKTIREQLDQLAAPQRLTFFTKLVEVGTNQGQKPPQTLVVEILNEFRQEAELPLNQRARRVFELISALHALIEAPEGQDAAKIISTAEKLSKATKIWDQLAQPFQILAKSQGQNQPNSQIMAMKIRELAFLAYNSHGYLSLAQNLTKLLGEVFAEVVDVAEQAEKDRVLLDQLAQVAEVKAKDQLSDDSIRQTLAQVVSLVKDINAQLKKNPQDAELTQEIDQLIALLGTIALSAQTEAAVEKVILMSRTLALSLRYHYGRANSAMAILSELSRIFQGTEPFGSLFASDLESIRLNAQARLKWRDWQRRLPKFWKIALIALIFLALLAGFLFSLKNHQPEPPSTKPLAIHLKPPLASGPGGKKNPTVEPAKRLIIEWPCPESGTKDGCPSQL